MDSGLILIIFSLLLLGAFFYFFERSKLSANEISIIVVLAALATLGRIPFAVIPGAQFPTFIIIICGFTFGSMTGFMVAVTVALVSNIFLGHGPWTIFQMLAWGLCGISSGLLGKYKPNTGKITFIIYGVVWAFLFGWIMNLWHWLSFIKPLTFKSWILVNGASIPFDIVHALTNALFLGFFGAEFIKILKRFKRKLYYQINIDD